MKKLFAIICVLAMVLALVGCQANDTDKPSQTASAPADAQGETPVENPYAKKVDFTMSSIILQTEGLPYEEDALYQTLSQKFNLDYELYPLNWNNWQEKTRIWISSGDMPDVTFWNFNYVDYISYAKQGLIKALPEDYATKYPNLEACLKKTPVTEYVKKYDGNLYCIPKVVYMDLPTDVLVDHIMIYYRKDWAKQVGIELGSTATYEEIADMAKAFVEKDPGGNGAGNTIGISSTPQMLSHMFVKPFNNNYIYYHKVDGKYVWGPGEASTLEGILKMDEYYNAGIIDRDFYAYKGNEYRSKFYAGLAGMMYDYGTASNFNHRISEFSRQNPDLDVDECLGYVVPLGTDGKYHGDESMNFWSASLFNPSIDDEKFSRILDLFDYASTKEAQMLINLGIEGEDYTVDGDEITITREKNENGEFKPLIELYPSNECLYTFQILPDNFSLLDPSIPQWQRDTVIKMFQDKVEMGDNRKVDFDVEFFTGEVYTKTKLTNEQIIDAITAAVLSDDTAAEWNTWVDENRATQDAVLQELNENLND